MFLSRNISHLKIIFCFVFSWNVTVWGSSHENHFWIPITYSRYLVWLERLEANLRTALGKEALLYLAWCLVSLHFQRTGLELSQLHSLSLMAPASHHTAANCFSIALLASSSPALRSLCYLCTLGIAMSSTQHQEFDYCLPLLLTQVQNCQIPNSQEWNLNSPVHLSEPDLIRSWSLASLSMILFE